MVARRVLSVSLLAAVVAAIAACDRATDDSRTAVPGQAGRFKTAATDRAHRREYDGAPPVIPHAAMGVACIDCHNERGLEVPGVGFAPPSPHAKTLGLSDVSRCRQCHVERSSDSIFADSGLVALLQDLRHGSRAHPLAPPVIPHRVFMRENCQACHAGPAAREEVRCSHPERARCQQCHVPVSTSGEFARL